MSYSGDEQRDDEQPRKILPKPVDFDELYPGRFMKAGEFKGQKLTMKIAAVDREILVTERGEKEKVVLSFEKTDKQFVANKTNGLCLRQLFGSKPQEWVGRRVTLYPTQVESGFFRGKDCIRVWGSPDLEKDLEFKIVLPRKRPIPVTLHKTLPPGPRQGGAPAQQQQRSTTAAAPTNEQAIAQVREAKTIAALAEARKTVWGLYAAANVDVPLEVEIAANDRRLALGGE